MKDLQFDSLRVSVYEDLAELGRAAAATFAEAVNRDLSTKEEASVVLALGTAQDSFFAALKERSDIPWGRLTVLHVDTYLGLADDRPESGASRLRRHLLDEVQPKAFFPMIGDHEPVEEEIARYTDLLRTLKPQVCTVGVGDTGHLAFNDPPADFETTDLVDVVELNEITRRQIHAAGIFENLVDVPQFGLTLTMHALMQPETVIALVHEGNRANVIRRMLEEPVSPMCPASLLREHPNARLYLSSEAAAELTEQVP
jgi:glucosamine-6-phosphate deaminase